jgi:Spy/CpxP family protein refolding chaperone
MQRSVLAFLAIVASIAMQAPAPTGPQPGGGSGQAAAMAESASAFLATLTPSQRAKIVHSFEDDAARTNWSNLPPTPEDRDGLLVAVLTAPQRIAFHDMLMSAMSSQGYVKSAAIMWLDDILQVEQTGRLISLNPPSEGGTVPDLYPPRRSSANYRIVMFGQPGSARWGWMLTGHHLAANFTVVDGAVAFTPLFVGANPQLIQAGPYAGWRVLGHETARAFALARSLTAQQRRAAIISGSVDDELFTGEGRKDQLKTMTGLPVSSLSERQQQQLWALVREFVASAHEEAADAKLRSIERDGLGQLHFAWWGSTTNPSQRFMYRIHGPSILIEYVREGQGSAPLNHVHAIVRDPRNDYGEDWLGKHYREQPHP